MFAQAVFSQAKRRRFAILCLDIGSSNTQLWYNIISMIATVVAIVVVEV
jgi:hypothetical protein